MYKYICSILLSVFFLSNIKAQFLYKKGTIVPKHGDSLECMIKIQPSYEKKLYFKKDLQSEEDYIDFSDLKYMYTKDQYFAAFKINDKFVLGQLSIPAQDSLFFYIIQHRSKKGSYGNVTTQGTNYEYVYLLNKRDEIVELTEQNYKDKLQKLFSACELSMERLNSPQYTFEHVPNIVEEYYRCIN